MIAELILSGGSHFRYYVQVFFHTVHDGMFYAGTCGASHCMLHKHPVGSIEKTQQGFIEIQTNVAHIIMLISCIIMAVCLDNDLHGSGILALCICE